MLKIQCPLSSHCKKTSLVQNVNCPLTKCFISFFIFSNFFKSFQRHMVQILLHHHLSLYVSLLLETVYTYFDKIRHINTGNDTMNLNFYQSNALAASKWMIIHNHTPKKLWHEPIFIQGYFEFTPRKNSSKSKSFYWDQ